MQCNIKLSLRVCLCCMYNLHQLRLILYIYRQYDSLGQIFYMYSQHAAVTVPTHLVRFSTVCYSTSYVLQIYCSAFNLHLHFREHFRISTPPHSCLYNARRLHSTYVPVWPHLYNLRKDLLYISHLFLRLRLPLWPSLYVFSGPSLALISRWL
jgi:hypothetical protein